MEEYKRKFKAFLKEGVWNQSLLPYIGNILRSDLDDASIDSFIQSITKQVEIGLRNAYHFKLGTKIEDSMVGIQLLDFTVDGHLIDDKELPIYHLIYWILKEPRNVSHHHFKINPLKELMLYVLECDAALASINDLAQSDYNVNFKIKLEDEARKLEIYDVEVFTPTNVKINSGTKIEARIKHPDGSYRTTPLTYGSGYWTGNYDTRGAPMGTFTVNVGGYHKGANFVAQSGSMAMVYQPHRTCTRCGHPFGVGDQVCTNCRGYVNVE